MTKKDVIEFAEKHDLNVDYVLKTVRGAIEDHNTSWNVLTLCMGAADSIAYMPCGYRKHTTDQYVPNAYRSNFGWKNTYYQAASLVVTFRV